MLLKTIASLLLTSVMLAQDAPAPSLADAQRLISAGNYAQAVTELQRLKAADPKAKGLDHALATAYYRQGDFLHAQAAFADAITADPGDREAVQLRGISLYQIGRPAEAIPLLKQVQSWDPQSVEAAYALALAYIQTHDYDSARKQAATMYGVPDGSAASYLFTARLLLRQEYGPVAEQFAQKAVALDPKLPLAHFLLGEFYLYKSDFPKAATEFETELKLNPGYAGTYDRLADTYYRISKLDDAERLLRRALLLDANSTGPYILMGKVQLKKRDFAQAQMYLERAVKMDPNNYISHHLLGETYRGAGRQQQAEQELKLAEQLQSAQHPQIENAVPQ